jgi:hypothetical protein
LYHGACLAESQKGVKLWKYICTSKTWKTETLIWSFYGRKGKVGGRTPAGHAVGFHGPGPWFFDANGGLYSKFSETDSETIAWEIKDYIQTLYWDFPHERFLLCKLGRRI